MNFKFAPALRELLTSIFIASLLLILHHQMPLIEIFDRFAFMFASANSVRTPAGEAATVVIGIDQATYEQDFREQSPLDRCVMRDKLARLYAAQPRVLAIDFDLSPTLGAMLEQAPDRAREQACQRALDTLLAAPRTTRTVLIEPFAIDHAQAQAARLAWREALRTHGVEFGQARLPVQFGVVQQQYRSARTFAAVAHAAARGTPPAPAHDETARDAHGHASGPVAVPLQLLNFRAFGTDVQSLQWRDWLAATPSLSLAGKDVFFGANYGADDLFITPLDELYGVNIHAAAFVSLDHQINRANGWLGLGLDVAIGLLFGRLVGFFWGRYLRTQGDRNWYAFAFLWLFVMGIVYAGLVMALGAAAAALIAAQNIWISPLPMALGMTIDAFIMGAIHALGHARAHAAGAAAHDGEHGAEREGGHQAAGAHGLTPRASLLGAPRRVRLRSGIDVLFERTGVAGSPRPPLPTRVMGAIKVVCWLAVVAYTVTLLLHH